MKKRMLALLALSTAMLSVPAAAQSGGAPAASPERLAALKRNLLPGVTKLNQAIDEVAAMYERRRAANPSMPPFEEAFHDRLEQRAADTTLSSPALTQAIQQIAAVQETGKNGLSSLSSGQQDALTANTLRAGLNLALAQDDLLATVYTFVCDATETMVPPGEDARGVTATLDSARLLLAYGRTQAGQTYSEASNGVERNMETITSTVRNAGAYRDPNDKSDLTLHGPNGVVVIHADGSAGVQNGTGDYTLFGSRDGKVAPNAQAAIRAALGKSDALLKALTRILQINGNSSGAGGSNLVAGFDIEDIDAATLETLRQTLPNGQLPHLPTIPASTWQMFENGGAVSTVELEAIYAGYQPALTAIRWESLDIYPPGSSSVATVPEVPWYSLSSLGTALSAAGTSLPLDWISQSAVGQSFPIGYNAWNSAYGGQLAGTSSSLSGPLGWLVGPDGRPSSGLIGAIGDFADTRDLSSLWALLFGDRSDPLRSDIRIGEELADARNTISTGGLSDIGISGLSLSYLLRDFGTEDGDQINVTLRQFGRVLYEGQLSLLNAGTAFKQQLRPGVADLTITALNEGSLPPNTAEVRVDNVVRGNATQSYSLNTGQSAVLRIESNARATGGN